jgi:hypothetical protein
VDDERIKALTDEVMKQISSSAVTPDLEDRVTALERAVHGISKPPIALAVVAVHHPSHSLLGPEAPPGGHCVMEPDKPCVQSGMCRTLGH